jgi:hypothetical protein
LKGQRDQWLSTETVQPFKSLAWRKYRHLAPTTNRESIPIPRYHRIAAIGRLHAAESRLYISAALNDVSLRALAPSRAVSMRSSRASRAYKVTQVTQGYISSNPTHSQHSDSDCPFSPCTSVLTIPSQVKSTPSRNANFDQPCTTNPSPTRQESLAITAPFTCRDDTTTMSSSHST